MSAVHFYTSCTQTKSAPVPPSLSAQALRNAPVAHRFADWRLRLDTWTGERRTVLDLYSGGHWSVVRNLATGKSIGTPRLNIYAISAGYGIISIESLIAPYAATFAAGHSDSVSCARGKLAPSENAAWWYELTNWRPIGVRGPRSIFDVFRAAPKSIHIFALSPSYLDAISSDLLAAREELTDPRTLVVISTAKKRHGALNSSVIPAPARLQTIMGGALTSLNVRLASRILNVVPVSRINVPEIQGFVSELMGRTKPRKIQQRRVASDITVVDFIKESLHSRPNPSYTRTLRTFREAGNACEMKRFKKLFQQTVTNQNNGSISKRFQT